MGWVRRGYHGLHHSLHSRHLKGVGDSKEGKKEGGLGGVGGGGGRLPSPRNRRCFEKFEIGKARKKKNENRDNLFPAEL